MSTSLIVVGMHRSGTSATTGALQHLGVDLGGRLYAGHKDINAKGYFEHSDIADTNDELLACLGSHWDDVLPREPGWHERPELRPYIERLKRFVRRDFASSEVWALKDPRVCRLLPLWLPLLRSLDVDVRFLFVVRPADEVASSLHKRDQFSRDKALALWLLHYLEAESMSRGQARVFMAFDRFVAAPQAELERAAQALGIRYPKGEAEHMARLNEFVSPTLRHHQSAGLQPDRSALEALAFDTERHLLAAAHLPPGAVAPGLDALQERLAKWSQSLDPLLVEQLRGSARTRGDLQLTVIRAMRSASWVVGKPIRFAERLLGRPV